MRILAVHRYFWPDTPPYAYILRAIASHLVKDGHYVEILSSYPSYKKSVQLDRCNHREKIDGINIHRIHLPYEKDSKIRRLLNAIKLSVTVIFKSIWNGPYDVIMSSTSPPIILAFACNMASKITGAKYIY